MNVLGLEDGSLSHTENNTFSVTTWEYLWPPNLHYLDEYLNLSSFLPIHIEGLILGDKLKAEYFNDSDPNFGWKVLWLLDADKLDEYYYKHYANNTESMILCTPFFTRKHGNTPVNGFFKLHFVLCYNYTPGGLDNMLRLSDWEYMWKTNKYPMSAMFSLAAAVFIAGLFGKTFYC